MKRVIPAERMYIAYFFGIASVFIVAFLKCCARMPDPIYSEMGKGFLPLLEVASICGLGLILSPFRNGNFSFFRWSLYFLLPLITALVYIAQCYSLHLSNSYITVLAMENTAEGRLTNSMLLELSIAAAVFAWLFLLLFTLGNKKKISNFPRGQFFATAWVFVISFYAWAFFSTQNSRGLISLQPNQAPLISLLRSSYILAERRLSEFRPDESEFDGEIYYAKDDKYPFRKDFVYNSPLPFERVMGVNKKRNVIVIFTEGMSSRLISGYGGRRGDLTPNIDRFLSRSMRVDNYFNHTAATYRGLQGQMASGFPGTGGADGGAGWGEGGNAASLARISYRTLPQIFNERGYDTYFFSPHHDSVKLNTMLRSLFFKKIYSFDEINDGLLGGRAGLTAGSMSDRDLFRSLKVMLQQRDASNENKPFFIGLYDIGTHAFLDVPEGAEKYADGSNSVLNRMHNYDHQFGEFLDYFFSSKYNMDTILVFTADHATYPEPPYVAAVRGEAYLPVFVDRIPLAIYDPALVLPQSFDAAGRTSIDFAPSLLHLLGIRKTPNSFLGRSIFEPRRTVPFGVAAIGGDFFMTTREGVTLEQGIPTAEKAQFLKYKDYVRTYYSLEKQNRIFPTTNINMADNKHSLR